MPCRIVPGGPPQDRLGTLSGTRQPPAPRRPPRETCRPAAGAPWCLGRRSGRAPDGRRDLARAGEEAAALFFEARGYRIEARNLRLGRCELDLILRRGCDLVFCEVKTRRGGALGKPEEAVDGRKRERIVRAASAYLARRPPAGDVRFDVMSVREDGSGRLDLCHIPGAFRPW